jgi:programmed cell death 6-interacting protein
MKELTAAYSDLLQDKRVRSEQSKYEALSRQRNSVMSKYNKVYNAFGDLNTGLEKARKFYSEISEQTGSLQKNVETFVNNRRTEGAQLLNQIEKSKETNKGGDAERERERLRELMERMSMDPSSSPVKTSTKAPRPPPLSAASFNKPVPVESFTPMSPPPTVPHYPAANYTGQYGAPPPQAGYNPQYAPSPAGGYSQAPQQIARHSSYGGAPGPSAEPYNPSTYQPQRRESVQSYQTPISPPPWQQTHQASHYPYGPPPATAQPQQQGGGPPSYVPPGYVPPPPPSGPPPAGQQQAYPGYPPPGPGGYSNTPPPPRMSNQPPPGHGQGDPWAGLSAWR